MFMRVFRAILFVEIETQYHIAWKNSQAPNFINKLPSLELFRSRFSGFEWAVLPLRSLQVLAMTLESQLVATSFNPQRLLCRGKSQAMGDTVLHHIDVGILKFHNRAAIDAYKMIVMGTLEKIRIVKPLSSHKRNLAQHAALHKQCNRSVNCGTGYRRIALCTIAQSSSARKCSCVLKADETITSLCSVNRNPFEAKYFPACSRTLFREF